MTNPTFNALLEEIAALHERKNADYAEEGDPYSNFRYAAMVSEGFTDPLDRVFATLMGVKLARLQQLTRPGRVPRNEPTRDSRVDLVTYSALWAAARESDTSATPPAAPHP